MVEPVSIIMMVNGALGITRSLVHTVKELYELAEAYETAALGIRTVATQCNSFRVAIQRIHSWLMTQDESSRYNLDEDFWQALADNLETGRLVLEDLEKRIAGLKKDSAKFWIRTKYLWNSVVISELQSQIQGLMSAVSILVQVIDIPTTGGRRTQSLAQRSRLNTITKTVRLTVDQRRERIRQSQEQNLLDGVEDDSASAALSPSLPASPPTTSQQLPSRASPAPPHDSINNVIQQQAGESTTDVAPPPYDFYDKDRKETKSRSTSFFKDKKKSLEAVSTEKENPSRTLDRPESKDAKSKRSIWTMNFKKRTSTPKIDQVLWSTSDPRDNNSKDVTESSTTSQILNPFDDSNSGMQHTPAPIDPSKQEHEYFGLQEAMVGMSMPSTTNTISEGLTLDRIASREIKQVETSSSFASGGPAELPNLGSSLSYPSQPTFAQTICPPTPQNPLPEPTGYELLSRIASEPKQPDTTSTTSQSHYPPRPELTNPTNPPTSPPTNPYASLSTKPATLDRIRPSQRVREARERSRSHSRSRDPHGPRPRTSPDRLTRQITPTAPTSQTWRTTATATSTTSTSTSNSLSTSSTTRLKITFSPTSYTSRISHSAAHTLHLLDLSPSTSTSTLSDPIALLTLLYPVSDGTSETVLADEIELEVMHEGESRGLEIVFGAAQGHFAGVMEGSKEGCLWWSERGVPRGLRTIEGLRLFRRFELVRW